MQTFSVSFVGFFLLGSVALAGPPSIRELRPWGGQRGQTVTLTVAGDVLAPGADLFSAVPGKIEEQPGGNAGQLTFKLEIRPEAAVGVYPIRLRTAGGLSNVLLFNVGDLPELAETEPNDVLPANPVAAAATTSAPATLPLIATPATINGSASGTDQDVFRFAGKKGQRIVAEIEALRIGSMLDPAIHLMNAAGREFAFADDVPGLGLDCRIDVTLPEDGEYFVLVHDSKYAGGNPGHYRLKLGAFAYAESAFPLGWQRGREVEVALFGGALTEPLKTKIVANAAGGQGTMFLSPPVPGPQARLPFRFVLGDGPELIEPADGTPDADRWFKDAAVMNGRIAKSGEVDRYKFPVAAGQTWVLEVDAANLGSPLDALVTVAGPQGNVLVSADDGNGLDPRLQFTAPAGVDHVVLAVEDLHGRGGPLFAYRLKAARPRTDFSLQVVPAGSPAPGAPPAPPPLGALAVNIPRGGISVVQINVTRNGYNGPIQLTIPESLSGITAEDGLVAAGAPNGLLVLSVANDAPLRAFDLEIRGQGGSPTQPMTRPAESSGRAEFAMADAFVARVPAAVCEAPPATFNIAERSIKILHGHNRQLKITVARGPNATEAVAVTTGSPVISVGGTAGTIAKESNEMTLTLTQNPELPALGTFTMQLVATTQAAGRQEAVQLPPVKVEIVRPFSLELLNQNATLNPGTKVRIAAVVRRESPFEGMVKIGPAGSLAQGVSLTMVEVPKGESLALLELSVSDAVAPTEFDLQIRATTDMEGRKRDKDYVIPDTQLKVKIVPKAVK